MVGWWLEVVGQSFEQAFDWWEEVEGKRGRERRSETDIYPRPCGRAGGFSCVGIKAPNKSLLATPPCY